MVLSDDSDPVIDHDATAAKRRELLAMDRPIVVPTEPDAAEWVKENMRDGDVYLVNPS